VAKAERKTPWMAALVLAAIVFAADQAIKWVLLTEVRLQSIRHAMGIEILPFFDLRYVENRGISMGFLTADTPLARWALVAMTLGIVVGILFWLRREERRPDALALGAVLGGALGNILDRARLGFVFDYADFHLGAWRPFLVFNVADAAITVGVAVLLVRAIFVRDKEPESENADA